MIEYVILLILVVLSGIIILGRTDHYKNRRIFLVCSFAMMALLLGLRSEKVGVDTPTYLYLFQRVEKISWGKLIFGGIKPVYDIDEYGYRYTLEIGFLIFCKIVRTFTGNQQVFLLVLAGISCGLFARFIEEYSEDVFFSTIIFLTESVYLSAFNEARQVLAMGIALQAVRRINKRQWVRALVIVLLAISVHNTAVVFLLLIPLCLTKKENFRREFRIGIVLEIGLIVCLPLIENVIVTYLSQYGKYLQGNRWESSYRGIIVLWMVEIFLIINMYMHQIKNHIHFLTMAFVSLYITFEIAGMSNIIFSRLSLYFQSMLILFFPAALNEYDPKTKMAGTFAIYFLLLVLFLRTVQTGNSLQYSFYFQ